MAQRAVQSIIVETGDARQKSARSGIMRKVIGVGSTTLASRLLGLVREILMGKFLGTGLSADLFFTAYKLPNSLRKIFAEGALSAALVPTCVQVAKTDSQKEVSRLISLSLVLFQTALLIVCCVIGWKADLIIKLIAPGWFIKADTSFLEPAIPVVGNLMRWLAPAWFVMGPIPPDITPVIGYVRILIGFILCLSSSALLAAALQAKQHFFVPAVSPVLLNIIYVGGLLVGVWWGLSVNALCGLIMLGGVLQAILHLITYFYLGFEISRPTPQTWIAFRKVVKKFLPYLLSMSIMEINLFVSTSLATYLPSGSIASIYYANRFMGIPLGVFAVALSTILLPYFSKISSYAPQRLGYYLFESAKLIFWVTLPLSLLLIFYSDKIFLTLFLSKKFTVAHAYQAGLLLSVFSAGLFFFSLNKILLNVCYALHQTRLVTWISILTALSNYLLSRLLVSSMGVAGLALAFVLAAALQSLILAICLGRWHSVKIYTNQFLDFVFRAVMQCGGAAVLFLGAYQIILMGMRSLVSQSLFIFFTQGYGLWSWGFFLMLVIFKLLLMTRRFFGIRLAFLN